MSRARELLNDRIYDLEDLRLVQVDERVDHSDVQLRVLGHCLVSRSASMPANARTCVSDTHAPYQQFVRNGPSSNTPRTDLPLMQLQ